MSLLVLGIITIILTTKIFPWKKFGFMSSIQYPWRFNLVATFVLSIVSAYAVYHSFETIKKEMCIVVSIIIVCMASLQLDNVDINIVNGSYDYLINWAPVANGEYLPINFDKESDYNKKVINMNNGSEYEYKRDGSKLTFIYDNDGSGDTVINIPLIYYKGYVAKLENDEKVIDLPVSIGQNGLVSVSVSKGVNGKITVEYKMTRIQKIGRIVTLICLILTVSIIFIEKKKRKDKIS